MKKYTPKDILRSRVALLKAKQSGELILLKEEFFTVYESFPSMLIKNSLRGLISTPQGGSYNILNAAIGLTTGFLSKKLLIGGSHNPVKKILGALLQFAVAKVVSKHPDTIKSTGGKLLKGIFSKFISSAPTPTTNAYEAQSSHHIQRDS